MMFLVVVRKIGDIHFISGTLHETFMNDVQEETERHKGTFFRISQEK